MQYHKTVTDILELLKTNNCWFETFEHAPVRTSEEAANVRTGYTLQQGAKALIVRIKKDNEKKFVMLAMPADKKFNGGKVKSILGTNDFRFATEDEVSEITHGVQVGGVPPFGNLFNLPVYADETLFENEKIIFNAGDRSFSIAMKSEDYKKLVSPLIHSIV